MGRRRHIVGALAAAGLAVVLAGCSAGTPTVSVAYAGSLATLMDQQLGPAFAQAEHVAYQGRGGGSFGLAREIAAGTVPADVFFSLGTAPLDSLRSKTSWAVRFATSPLVVAYNPKSPYAPALDEIRTGRRPIQDLFSLMAQPGFHLGRTNPATDPQGRAFYLMVLLAQQLYHLPAGTARKVLGPPDNPRQVFSETGILSQLQAGALDAASAFLPEAVERHLPYIALPNALNFADPADAPLYAQASFTLPRVGTVRGAPLAVVGTVLNQSRLGLRFLTYALSPAGRRIFEEDGYRWIPFTYWGNAAKVPAAVRHESP